MNNPQVLNDTVEPGALGDPIKPFLDVERLHFIGVGGIGMSAIAEILLSQGIEVSGSDLLAGPLTEKLSQKGARIEIGHRAENLGSAQVVVVSSAIASDNPEWREAEKRRLPIVHRAQVLGELMRRRIGIAVTGTHGKSTVTSMLAVMLLEADQDPTVINGARLQRIQGNAHSGRGVLLVAEADESDRSFLHLHPVYGVVTNIDLDHMDTYRDLDDLKSAFCQFLQRLPFYGLAVICADDPNLTDVVENIQPRVLTYGLTSEADFTAEDLRFDGSLASYRCLRRGTELGEIQLGVPGRHNVLNSLAAVALGLHLGLSFEQVRQGLARFGGTERRLEWKGEKSGVWVMDDYGHHPTEIRVTLEACRAFGRRILVVYQPHRYSRTLHTLDETARAFDDADQLFLMDVYAAGESPDQGTDSARLAQAISDRRPVQYLRSRSALLKALKRESRPGDVLLTLGAGDVWKVGEEYLGHGSQ